MSLVEVKVPDIGDFKDVDVIEVNIKPGDTIEKEQSLLTLESDKASMEVPSDTAGTVKEVRIKPGDKVSQGTVIALVEATAGGAAAAAAEPKAPEKAAPAPAPAAAAPKAAAPAAQAGSYSGSADIECDMLVLGSGPGGYSAAFRSADLGMKTVLVERYPTLGGVCLNVGCIPSKALLHTALVIDEAADLAAHGITFGKPQIDLDKLRDFKSGVVRKLTGGLAGMAKARKVEVVVGTGAFVDPNHMEVQTEGGKKVVRFNQAIIAAGSEAVKLPFIPEDPRVVDSTGALELRQIPQRMLVIGGGIIGLEMATVYSTLGANIDVVEMLDVLMAGADRDLVKVWEKYNSKRFANVMLKTKTIAAEAKDDGIYVSFEGEQAPAGSRNATTSCWWPSAARRTASGSARKRPASRRRIAASSKSTGNSARMCRTSSRSATSSVSRCSRTRPCTKATWRRKPRMARRRTSTRCRFRRWPTPIRKWLGLARRKTS
ncbi:NADPH-dependent 2,4-dienoyl-CoA reductase/sulfur reductase-like enzyme [Paraburkholderia sp. MM5482-R2]